MLANHNHFIWWRIYKCARRHLHWIVWFGATNSSDIQFDPIGIFGRAIPMCTIRNANGFCDIQIFHYQKLLSISFNSTASSLFVPLSNLSGALIFNENDFIFSEHNAKKWDFFRPAFFLNTKEGKNVIAEIVTNWRFSNVFFSFRFVVTIVKLASSAFYNDADNDRTRTTTLIKFRMSSDN